MLWFMLNEQQSRAIAEIEHSGSDRIVTVVGGALLDQSLRVALQSKMRQDKKAFQRLFKDSGPLASSNKVELAYLLHLVEEPMRDAMEAICQIRNLFAHQLDMSFKFARDQRMKDALSKLVLHKGKPYFPGSFWEGDSTHSIDPVTDERSRFLVNLQLSLIWLGCTLGQE